MCVCWQSTEQTIKPRSTNFSNFSDLRIKPNRGVFDHFIASNFYSCVYSYTFTVIISFNTGSDQQKKNKSRSCSERIILSWFISDKANISLLHALNSIDLYSTGKQSCHFFSLCWRWNDRNQSGIKFWFTITLI